MADNDVDIVDKADLSGGVKKPPVEDVSTKPMKADPEDLIDDSKIPKSARWLIKYSFGRVKTERQAVYVLVSLACVLIIVSVVLFLSSGSNSRGIPEIIRPAI